MSRTVVTVCGGGNTSHVLVALLGSRPDLELRLLSRTPFSSTVACTCPDGSVVHGKAAVTSSSAGDVVPGSHVVIMPVPAYAYEPLLAAMRPFLDRGTVVLALPGQGGFNFIARQVLGSTADQVVLCGTAFHPFVCRTTERAKSVSLRAAKDLQLAVMPSSAFAQTALLLARVFRPMRVLAGETNFVAVHLTCANQCKHPAGMMSLLADWDGASAVQEVPMFYDVSSYGAELISAVSDDLVEVARVLSTTVDTSAVMSMRRAIMWWYGPAIRDTSTLRSCFCSNAVYAGIRAPYVPSDDGDGSGSGGGFVPAVQHRYFSEDVTYGLLCSKGVAQIACVATPAIDHVLRWAQTIMGRAFIDDAGQLTADALRNSGAPQAFGITSMPALLQACGVEARATAPTAGTRSRKQE